MTPGELLDKISILQVKLEMLKPDALKNVMVELGQCYQEAESFPGLLDGESLCLLRDCNRIQFVENEKLFEYFRMNHTDSPLGSVVAVGHLRKAHQANAERIKLKNRVNAEYGSPIWEEKSFARCV